MPLAAPVTTAVIPAIDRDKVDNRWFIEHSIFKEVTGLSELSSASWTGVRQALI
jgi:hypothetical protein